MRLKQNYSDCKNENSINCSEERDYDKKKITIFFNIKKMINLFVKKILKFFDFFHKKKIV